jgi:hypothetical protein
MSSLLQAYAAASAASSVAASRARPDWDGSTVRGVLWGRSQKAWRQGGGSTYFSTFFILEDVEIKYFPQKVSAQRKGGMAKVPKPPVIPSDTTAVEKHRAGNLASVKGMHEVYIPPYSVCTIKGLKWQLGEWIATEDVDGVPTSVLTFGLSVVCAQIFPQVVLSMRAALAGLPFSVRKVSPVYEFPEAEETRMLQLGPDRYSVAKYPVRRAVYFEFNQARVLTHHHLVGSYELACLLPTKYVFLRTGDADGEMKWCVCAPSPDPTNPAKLGDVTATVFQSDGTEKESGNVMFTIYDESLLCWGIESSQTWERFGPVFMHGAAGAFAGAVDAKTAQVNLPADGLDWTLAAKGRVIFDVAATIANVGFRVSRDRAFEILEDTVHYASRTEMMTTQRWNAFCGRDKDLKTKVVDNIGLQPGMRCVNMRVLHGNVWRMRDCEDAVYRIVSPFAHGYVLEDIARMSEETYKGKCSDSELQVFVTMPEPVVNYITKENRKEWAEAEAKVLVPSGPPPSVPPPAVPSVPSVPPPAVPSVPPPAVPSVPVQKKAKVAVPVPVPVPEAESSSDDDDEDEDGDASA